MSRNISRFNRLALTGALLLGFGCNASTQHPATDQPATPVSPIYLFLNLSTNKGSLTANNTDNFATLTLQVNYADTGAPVADGSKVNLSTTLGHFDTPTGPQTLALEVFGGKGSLRFYAGGTEGTARVRAEYLGVIDTVEITIQPEGEPPAPAPTASTLTATSDVTTVSEDAGSVPILVTATVIGSDAKPYKNAPIQMSAPTGTFDSSGNASSDVLATNSAGQAIDTLNVTGAGVAALNASSFNITVTLFTEGGGTKNATVKITIIAGAEPPVAKTVQLSTDTSTAQDDGSPQVIHASALVLDQFGATFTTGASVTFSCSIGSASFSSNPVVSNGSGIAATTITIAGADIASHPTDSFTITAAIAGDSDFVTVTIVRPAVEAPVAEFTFSGNPDSLGDTSVDFHDASTGGTPTTWAWDLDGDGNADNANTPNPSYDYVGLPACTDINVQLVVSNSAGSSSISHHLIVQPCP